MKGTLILYVLWLIVAGFCPAHSLASNNGAVGRRPFLLQSSGAAATAMAGILSRPNVAVAADTKSIAGRLESQVLTIPPTTSGASELNGVDNLYYPPFLAGEWSVTQTLVQVSAPLGLKFLGGPNGLESIASDTMSEINKKLNQPASLRLRYRPTKWGVAEDRLFNTGQRLNAFAGKSVVASVEYANVGGSNRPSVLAMGGTEDDPLQTTFVRFKGPAAQKTFVTSHGAENISDSEWAGYELDRSIFALTNQNTAPPVTTDTELIWMFEKISDDTVRGKLRIASYLNAQSDKLYFAAKSRAVSLQDYTLDMKRVSSS